MGTFQRTKDLVAWLEQQQPALDPQGRATQVLYERAVHDGAYTAGIAGFRDLLAKLDDEGVITRDIRGKRCYRIGPTKQAVEWQAPPGYETTATCCQLEHLDELPARRPRLTGTVHLSLDLDPATARLVLDLVEGAAGVVPVDRHDVQLMIARAIDKAAERLGASAERLGARMAEVELQLGTTVRQLGTSNGSSGPAEQRAVPRPSVGTFKRLGVRDAKQRELLADLVVDGWEVTKANNSHVRVSKAGHKSFSVSSTPSDHRTPDNERTRARRAGANV
jgi:hypothetical protein